MKMPWNTIKIVVLIAVLVFLFSFTKQRNNARKLTEIKVEFVDENEPFVTLDAVNKLLIQKQDSVTSILKERLVLKEAENRLLDNNMIKEAQVFVTVDGKLGAVIEQRNPIARVITSTDYYIDEQGKKMPLSPVFTARVPIVTGLDETHLAQVTPLLLKIKEDDFMRQAIVGVHKEKNGDFVLNIRKQYCKVILGKPNNMELKFQNFKAFFKKVTEDNTLNLYATVDLQFGNQVVATKK